ncbi:MAG: YqiA/YcfP family alpha/beta fold hydrolase [Myroides sp.]
MQYVYIHGFGTTGANSTKFKKILAHATANNAKAIALEWNEHQPDILQQLTSQLNNQINRNEPVCLIGSSTGGNFTYQLLEQFADKEMSFVLINPLLNVEQRKIDNYLFPMLLANQLKNPSEDLSNGLIILGKNDEVLDYNYTYGCLHKSNKIIVGEWNHTLSNLDTAELLRFIDSVNE